MPDVRPTPLELANDPSRHWGPAMADITVKQRAWVMAMVETGCNATVAAHHAGYGDDSHDEKAKQKACQMAGWTNAHSEPVQAAIKEEAATRVKSGALLAVTALTEIVADQKHKDRFKAALILGAMNGIQAIQVQEINVRHSYENVSTHDLIAKIKNFALTNNMDAAALLANAGVIDAEFEELPALPSPETAYSSDGLEDLL